MSSRLCSSTRLSSSSPPATLTVRGRVLTVFCLAIAPFSSRPTATRAVRGRFLTGGLPYYSDCDSFNYFLRVFPGFIARTFRGVGVGFEEPHLRFVALLGEPKFPRVSHISAHAAHQDGLVLWYGLGRPVITSEVGNWSVFVFVRMAFCIRDNHEMRRARAPHCQMPSGLWQ